LLHPRQQLTQIIDEATSGARVIAPMSQIIEHEPGIRKALGAYRPTLMFYGHYNAGKSTLVNSLLSRDGKPVANTADRPCTDAIDGYTFGDYTVFDTPGIDAPIEHEKVSRTHLQSTHVIVFVMTTSGDVDEGGTIEELVSIWGTGRPLIVVLNDKQGHKPDSAHVEQQVITLYENLKRAAGTSAITEAVDVLWVNAMRGWKARVSMCSEDPEAREKGAKLWELSNIDTLEVFMMNALMKTTGDQLLRPAADTLEKALAKTIIELETIGSSEEESDFYESLKSLVASTRARFIQRGESALKSLAHDLQGDLYVALEAGLPLTHMYDEFSERVSRAISDELLAVQQDLLQQFDNVNSGSSNINFDLGPEGANPFQANEEGDESLQFDLKRSGEVVAKYFESGGGKDAIKAVLLKLRKWKIPGFKGRWERTLGKWAGKVGKGLGVAIQVASVGYEIHGAVRAHQEAMRAEQNRVETLRRHTSRLANDAEGLVRKQLPSIAHEAFKGIDDEVTEQLANANEQDESIKSLIARLRELRLEVIKIQATI
jgi:hypothetical protein